MSAIDRNYCIDYSNGSQSIDRLSIVQNESILENSPSSSTDSIISTIEYHQVEVESSSIHRTITTTFSYDNHEVSSSNDRLMVNNENKDHQQSETR